MKIILEHPFQVKQLNCFTVSILSIAQRHGRPEEG